MPGKYENLEVSVKTRLNILAEEPTKYFVDTTPQGSKAFTEMLSKGFSKPAIYVCYTGSKYKMDGAKPVVGPTDIIEQEETFLLEVLLLAKTRHGLQGIYTMIDLVQGLLLGWKAAIGRKLFMVGIEWEELESNVWQYCITFGATTVAMEDTEKVGLPEGDIVLGILKKMQLNESAPVESEVIAEAPAVPVLTLRNTSETTIFFRWDLVEKAQGYYIDVATNEDFTTMVVNNLKTTTLNYTATGLISGTTYYIRVRAFNHETLSENSDTLTVTTI